MNRNSETTYQRRLLYTVLVVGLFVGLVLFVWRVADILLLLFVGLLLAILLRTLARPLTRRTPLPAAASLAAVIFSLVALFGAGGYFLAPQLANQISGLVQQLPEAVNEVQRTINQYDWAEPVLNRLQSVREGSNFLSRITGTFSTTLNALTHTIFILFVGVFLASNPALYRAGFLKLVPPQRRERAAEVTDEVVQTLREWLLGRFVSMAVIGVVATVGLWLIGVPLAPSLGILTGLLEFIPVIGPFFAAVPAILLAFTNGYGQVLWVIGLFIAIEQLEGNLLVPLVQQRTVSLPPAVTLTSVLIFGVLFGFLGLLVATPLAAVILVLVRRLYVEDTLGDTPEIEA